MEQPSQTSKKRSGTVAGMKDGLKKATTDMLVLFSFEAKANVCLRNASGNGPA